MKTNRKPVHGGNRERAETEKAALTGTTNFQGENIILAKTSQGICALLLQGEANALTAAELARLAGQTPRDVTRSIQRARLAGKPICASGAGYFLASDAAELARCVRGLDRRLREIRRTREALGDILQKTAGRESVKGWSDGE